MNTEMIDVLELIKENTDLQNLNERLSQENKRLHGQIELMTKVQQKMRENILELEGRLK